MSLPNEELVSIPQESALALALVNIAIIGSRCGKQSVRIKCDGDTSQEEAAGSTNRSKLPMLHGIRGVKIRIIQSEEGQGDPGCTNRHLQRGEIPTPAENGVSGRTREADGWKGGPRASVAALLGRRGLAGGGSKTPRKTVLEK